jgi:hypothetical protein
MVVLQNCIDLLKVVPGSYSEVYLSSSHDGNQVVNIKVEDFAGVEEEEDPLLIEFPVIKPEHEVSYMFLWTFLGTFRKYTKLLTVFYISIFL